MNKYLIGASAVLTARIVHYSKRNLVYKKQPLVKPVNYRIYILKRGDFPLFTTYYCLY